MSHLVKKVISQLCKDGGLWRTKIIWQSKRVNMFIQDFFGIQNPMLRYTLHIGF